MVKDICLVINNTGRDIKIGEAWEKYLAKSNRIERSNRRKVETIKVENVYKIKPSEFLRSRDDFQRWNNSELYKRVSLSDYSKNEVMLSWKEIDINIGFVICMDENNKLVKKPVSKEESKNSEKKNESEKDLKDRLLSIVKNRNDASARQLPSGVGEHLGQGEQKHASADLSRENKGENLSQDELNALPPSQSEGKNNKLAKGPFSNAESKRSEKNKESEEELKDPLISIEKNRNDASDRRLPSGEGEPLGQGEQKHASADLSRENKGENLSQDEQNVLPPSQLEAKN